MILIKKVQARVITGCLFFSMLFAACGNNGGTNILGIFDSSEGVKPKEFYEGLLEKFCQDYYDDLYHDFGPEEDNIAACLYHIVNGSYPPLPPRSKAVQTSVKSTVDKRNAGLEEEVRARNYGIFKEFLDN